ncbi:uncharacterized protein LOC115045619 isoform X2 [Echeneis naucrates]|uniref:uncharacterized protein LOC115045619 isoform X2 n=1 Tax=Echeneis naucrates TaxID=173247 RepID=UPI001113A149|nr:uncharacterized protein LOC115045619 isoform X2 [Echeneis naucrates]
MEDIGLIPKPTNDAPVHRPAVTGPLGPHHVPPVFNTGAKNGSTTLNRRQVARKTGKAKIADPSVWKQNKQKQLRMEEKANFGKRKKDGEIVTKEARAVGPRCTSNACKKTLNRLCNEINEESRKKVFHEFWQHMNWTQRKLYVAGQVDRDTVERSRAVGSQARRSVSLRYHLMVDGKRKQVCKSMFLSTLGIGEWSVLNWAQRRMRKKSDSNENKSEKRRSPPPSAVSRTVKVSQVNTSDKDRIRAQQPQEPAKKKCRVARPLTWKQNCQKQLRMEGKPYISKRKKDGVTITKAQRTMGPRCTSSACKKASNRFCADFSEEMRNGLFTGFWQCMNWAQRRIYVARLVDCEPVERTRAPLTQSRRSVSMQYHLIVNCDRKQVCKKMFLSTLGIGEWSVLNWAQNAAQQGDPEENTKKQTQRKSRKASEHVVLREFLENLPKAPSYRCGTSMSKSYLQPIFSNMSAVYRHYYNHCSARKTAPLSRQVFCAVFKKMDLGICDPKKNQSRTFSATGHLFNELWEEYCMERGAAGPQLEKARNPKSLI